MNISGVYKIVNLLTGDCYIGGSTNIKVRCRNHFDMLRAGRHRNPLLQEAYNTYGKDGFSIVIVEECQPSQVNEREQFHLDSRAMKGYNVTDSSSSGATKNWMWGKTHTPEAKRKLSDLHKGNSYAKGHAVSDDQMAYLSSLASQRTGSKNPFFGKKHSESTKLLIRSKKLGIIPPNIRRVCINGVEYNSLSDAGRGLGIPVPTVHYRIGSKNPKFAGYNYVD